MNNLHKIELFLKYDNEIKELLFKLAPNDNYLSNTDNLLNYLDILEKSLKSIKVMIIKMCSYFNIHYNSNKLNNLFDEYNKRLLRVSNLKELKEFYRNNLSNLSEYIINEANKEYFGYNVKVKQISEYINNNLTISELLHLIHSYVLNNENIYQSMPILNNKMVDKSKIRYYGEESLLASEIYSLIEDNLGGIIDILSIPKNNKILLMVRDRGHALTIDIEYDQENSYIKYFIPKICNYKMVNNLPGVDKVTKESLMTNGQFYVQNNELAKSIINFIKMVPTDFDMEILSDKIK